MIWANYMKYERTLSIVQAAYFAQGLKNNMDLNYYQEEGEDFNITLWEGHIVKGNIIACEQMEPPFYDNNELCSKIDESREI